MKKVLLLFAFVFFTLVADAQLVLSGHTTADVNGNYLLIDNLSHTLQDGTITDAGADYYRKSLSYGYNQIYRRNNSWYISNYFGLWNDGTFYEAISPISTFQFYTTSNQPPCVATWNKTTDFGETYTLTISGVSCYQPTYTGGLVVNPTNIQFPQLNPTAFNSIVPIKGMVTFFADENALKVYDGGQWRTLHGSLNDVKLANDAVLNIGNTYKITSITSKLNKLEVKEIKVSDALTVDSKSNFYKAMHLPVTIHSGNYDLILTDAMQIVVLNSTGSTARTFTLPAPNTAKGRIYELQNYTTNANLLIGGYTVQTNGSGGTISTILPGAGIRIFSDGTTWRKLN